MEIIVRDGPIIYDLMEMTTSTSFPQVLQRTTDLNANADLTENTD
jgi:hypothetical protein